MAVLKRLATRTQPCRTPDEMENASEIVPFTLTTLWVDDNFAMVYMAMAMRQLLLLAMVLRAHVWHF